MNTTTEEALENAKAYLEKGINVEGTGFLHLDDWHGNSGHPKWVENKLIPTLEKSLVEHERRKAKRKDKKKDREITERRGRPTGRSHLT